MSPVPDPSRVVVDTAGGGGAPGAAVVLGLAVLLVLRPGTGAAQTIADFGRAQRQWIEATMVQNAARAASLASSSASMPGAGPLAVLPSVPPTGPSPVRAPSPAPEPLLLVSGVFATSSRALAEVQVDGTAYLLVAGQAVPGTSWRVSTVAEDRVVLDRPGARDDAGHPAPVRRTFTLTAAR